MRPLWAGLAALLLALTLGGAVAWAQSAGDAPGRDVCQRTTAVRDALQLAVGKPCADIADADLAQVRNLSLGKRQLTALQSGDFAGLTGLETLNLSNNELTALPGGIFDGLTNLRRLWLHRNQIESLPEGVFNGLSALERLNLFRNRLENLPAGVFDDLSALERLYLSGNRLEILPDGLFRNLSRLELLRLHNNPGAPFVVALSRQIAEAIDIRGGLVVVIETVTPEPPATPEKPPTARRNHEEDRDALMALYNATDGPNWTDNTNWGTDAPIKEWYGVYTEPSLNDEKVRALILVNNNLTGQLPAALGSLDELEILKLSINRLHGPIPDWSGMADLEALHLGSNRNMEWDPDSDGSPGWARGVTNPTPIPDDEKGLRGPIPSWLVDMPDLEEVDFGWNSLTGQLPSSWNSGRLKLLRLRDNDLSGEIGDALDGLTGLERLSLVESGLTGELPEILQDRLAVVQMDNEGDPNSGVCARQAVYAALVANAATVYGAACNVAAEIEQEREILAALYRATNGDSWASSANWLSDEPLGTWHGVTTGDDGRVTMLRLAANSLSGSLPPELGGLAKLEFLELATNLRLSGSIPRELGSLANLEFLRLSDNAFSGSIPPELGNLGNLRELSLSFNNLSGSIPPELGGLTKLKSLQVNDNGSLSGPLPQSLTRIPPGQAGLGAMRIRNTGLCLPLNDTFQNWFEQVSIKERIDCAPVAVAVDDAEADEGERLTFMLTLDRAAELDTQLAWTLAHGETTGADFPPTQPQSGTLDIAAGAMEAAIEVLTSSDAVADPAETFTLTIAAAGDSLPNWMTLSRPTATGTIN